ncbi:hypothetical protein KDA14_03185 [Candidatus Saccharibacteria bacterium]|nr:hypothetical protein [Candidatus Saccharibacteria bacterium]
MSILANQEAALHELSARIAAGDEFGAAAAYLDASDAQVPASALDGIAHTRTLRHISGIALRPPRVTDAELTAYENEAFQSRGASADPEEPTCPDTIPEEPIIPSQPGPPAIEQDVLDIPRWVNGTDNVIPFPRPPAE